MKNFTLALLLFCTMCLISLAVSHPGILIKSAFIAWFAVAIGIGLIWRSSGINPLQRRSIHDLLGLASWACAIGMGIGEFGKVIWL